MRLCRARAPSERRGFTGRDPFSRCYGFAVLIERSMHPDWLSNAYLLADEPGGTAVFIDSGAPLEPLHEIVERYGVEIVKGPLETGGLTIEALETPGHASDHLAFVANETVAFTADILFKDAVGGGPDAAPIRASVMDTLMTLPHEVRVLPGHTDETTIGREWEENPFVRVWRGVDPVGTEAVRVAGEEATLIVWSPDYDGKGKAWVRFADGRDAIVGGSRVERS